MEAGRVKYTVSMMESILLSYFDKMVRQTEKYDDRYSWDDAYDFFQKNYFKEILTRMIEHDETSMQASMSITDADMLEMFENAMEDARDDE